MKKIEIPADVEELYEKIIPKEFKEELRLIKIKERKLRRRYNREWVRRNKGWLKDYYEKNKDKMSEINKLKRELYGDSIREKYRAYYLENKEKIKCYQKKYCNKNKEKIKIIRRRYYIKKRQKNEHKAPAI